MYEQTSAEYGAPGAAQRDRITQALMNVQNPPPATQMTGVPQIGGGMPPAPAPAMAGAAPPAATTTPGIGNSFPQLQQGSAMPSAMRPGGTLQPMPQPPATGPQY